MSFDQMLYRSEDMQLMEAIENNNIESVRMLVSREANINYRGRHGETHLIKSMLCEDSRISRFLTINGYRCAKKSVETGFLQEKISKT
jgi:hypothetical protein